MKRGKRSFAFVLVPVLSIFLSGCLDKTIYPAVILRVSSVAPQEVRPTLPAAGTTITLPTVTITIETTTQVPSRLVAYSIIYRTKLGQLIPALAVSQTPYDLILTPGGVTTISVAPYTQRVVDLFQQSNSDISPISAYITLTVKDSNRNTVNIDAHCQLYRPI